MESDTEEAPCDEDGKDDMDDVQEILDKIDNFNDQCSSKAPANMDSEAVKGAVADKRIDEELMDVTSDAARQPQSSNHLANNDGNSRGKVDNKNDLSADKSRGKAGTNDLSDDDNNQTEETAPSKRARLETPRPGGNGHGTTAEQHDSEVDALTKGIQKIRYVMSTKSTD